MTKMKPHLCTDVDLTKLVTPCWGLEKIDGVRMLHFTGSATGRSLKPHGNLFTTAKFSDPKYAWLDGEISFGDIRSESLCRDTTSVMSRIQGEPEVVWNLFDYLAPEVVDKPYKERYAALVEYVATHLAGDKSVRVVPYKVLNSVQEVEEHYEALLDEGFEGQIIRSPEGLTKFGRATVKEGAYMRRKPSSDKECLVLSLVEALENLNEAKVNALGHTERSSHKENKVGKGMVGMLVCKDLKTGNVIDVGGGKMTHDMRTFYWNNPEELVGKYIKYRSLDTGVKDAPRHARFIAIRAESDMS